MSKEQEGPPERSKKPVKRSGVKQLNIRISGKTLDQYHDIMAYYHRKREDISTVQLVSRGINAIWQELMDPKSGTANEVQAGVRPELEHRSARIWQFLEKFETEVEEFDAKRFAALSVPDLALVKDESEKIFTPNILLRLQVMQFAPDIDPATHQRVSVWLQAVERELFNLDLEPNRTALRQIIDNTRYQIQAKSYTTDGLHQDVLANEQERQLRVEAWNHLVHLSQETESPMREAMLKANALWQERNFRNANAPKLRAIGVSETAIRQIIANFEKTSRSSVQSILKECERLLGHEINLWDWQFAAKRLTHPFEQIFKEQNVVKAVQGTFKDAGIELKELPIRFIADASTQGVRVLPRRIPSDILVCHGVLQGHQGYNLLLSALGEACYYAHIDPDLPYAFRRGASRVLADGLAMLSSWIMWEPAWLEEFTSLGSDQIKTFSQQMKGYELLKLRHYTAFASFELDAYRALAEDPEANLDQLYGSHLEKFLRIPCEEMPMWALEHRLIEAVPYFAGKVLGMAVAASLAEILYKGDNSLFTNKLGRIFQSPLVRQGGSGPWIESLQKLTSRPITTMAMPIWAISVKYGKVHYF